MTFAVGPPQPGRNLLHRTDWASFSLPNRVITKADSMAHLSRSVGYYMPSLSGLGDDD